MFCSFVIFNTGFFFLSVCICFTFHPLFQLLHPIKLQKHLLHALLICFHPHHVSPLCAPLGGGGAQQAARHSQSPFYNSNGRLHDDGSSFSKHLQSTLIQFFGGGMHLLPSPVTSLKPAAGGDAFLADGAVHRCGGLNVLMTSERIGVQRGAPALRVPAATKVRKERVT